MTDRVSTQVCIIGAGPGGLSTAIFLAKAGIASTVLEKATFPRDKVCGDALSGKVVQTLKRMDPAILDRLHATATHIGSWGVTFVAPNGKALRVPFKKDIDMQGQAPGYIAKRVHFDDLLYQEALKYPEITILTNAAVKAFERTDGTWQLTTEAGTEVAAQLVVAADGAQSRFARVVGGIEKDPQHYCAGIRAYYKGVQGLDEQHFIELHFIKDLLPGYFWIFPLPNGDANVGLGVRSDVISERRLDLKAMLQKIVHQHPQISQRFRNAQLDGPLLGFGLPLGSKKRNISGDGYVLVGDAASLIDPFTGEGIGNAMISGQKAAEVLAEALSVGRTDAEYLKAYDEAVYKRMWNELSLSYKLQQLVNYPWLFNLVVNKAHKSATLQDTISCMFEDLEMRDRLKQPGFYLNLLLNR